MNLEGRKAGAEQVSSCFPAFQILFSGLRIFAVRLIWKQKRLGPDWGARRGASGSNGLRTLGGSRCVDRGGNHDGSEAGSRPGRQRDFPGGRNSEGAKTRTGTNLECRKAGGRQGFSCLPAFQINSASLLRILHFRSTRLPVLADLRAASRISVAIRFTSSEERPDGKVIEPAM